MHHHLRIRPDDDASSQCSTLTFYQSTYPSATAQVIDKQYSGGYTLYDSKAKKNVMKRKELLDEVKNLIAVKKIFKVLRVN